MEAAFYSDFALKCTNWHGAYCKSVTLIVGVSGPGLNPHG